MSIVGPAGDNITPISSDSNVRVSKDDFIDLGDGIKANPNQLNLSSLQKTGKISFCSNKSGAPVSRVRTINIPKNGRLFSMFSKILPKTKVNSLPAETQKIIAHILNKILGTRRAGKHRIGKVTVAFDPNKKNKMGPVGAKTTSSAKTTLRKAQQQGQKKTASAFQRAIPKASKSSIKAPTKPGIKITTVADNGKIIESLLKQYTGTYNEDWKKTKFRDVRSGTDSFDIKRLQPDLVMRDCLKAFVEIEKLQKTKLQDKHHVLLEKKIVSADTEIITTGDLHGDVFSLAKMVQELKATGKLNDNFELAEDVEIVFLGDYVDRGPDSWAVLNILSRLKLNNMDKVHLVRGNHETTKQIHKEGKKYGHWLPEDKSGGKTGPHDKHINKFFDHLPSAIFIGVDAGGERGVDFDIYTHGAVPLTFNPKGLNDQAKDGFYNIPKKLLDSLALGRKDRRYTFKPINSLTKQEKKIQALAEKVLEAVKRHGLAGTKKEGMAWDWADIIKGKKKGELKKARAKITIDEIMSWMDYTQASSHDKVRIRRLFKGHSHLKEGINKRGLRGKHDRDFYFMDTDLYKKGTFVMHSHQMYPGMMRDYNDKVYIRKFAHSLFEPMMKQIPQS